MLRLQANPHKRLRQLYGPRMMAQYRGVPLGELSPHVYAIAEQVGVWTLETALRLRQASVQNAWTSHTSIARVGYCPGACALMSPTPAAASSASP